MKVYTRRGDKGLSRLADHSCFDKSDCRFRVLGAIDELNSWFGLVRTLTEDRKLKRFLETRQKELFEAGTELGKTKASKKFSLRKTQQLEKEIDLWQKELPRLKNFIYPGGSQTAALLHLSRTVCRRVEQELVSLEQEEKINLKIITYFNRLSDWLFILARKINQEKGIEEEEWRQ